jgi:hypothetical protein
MIGSITKWNPTLRGLEDASGKDRWIEYLQENLKFLIVRNTQERANDRKEWKQYVVAVMDLKGL